MRILGAGFSHISVAVHSDIRYKASHLFTLLTSSPLSSTTSQPANQSYPLLLSAPPPSVRTTVYVHQASSPNSLSSIAHPNFNFLNHFRSKAMLHGTVGIMPSFTNHHYFVFLLTGWECTLCPAQPAFTSGEAALLHEQSQCHANRVGELETKHMWLTPVCFTTAADWEEPPENVWLICECSSLLHFM